MRKLQRRPDWRAVLHEWARTVQGKPYVWGETDCVSLTRNLLAQLFGEDLFPTIPQLHSFREAVKLFRRIDFNEVLQNVGARQLPPRVAVSWPHGTLLVGIEPSGLPAFSVFVEPFVVQSAADVGVQWSEPGTFIVRSAWSLTEAVIH